MHAKRQATANESHHGPTGTQAVVSWGHGVVRAKILNLASSLHARQSDTAIPAAPILLRSAPLVLLRTRAQASLAKLSEID